MDLIDSFSARVWVQSTERPIDLAVDAGAGAITRGPGLLESSADGAGLHLWLSGAWKATARSRLTPQMLLIVDAVGNGGEIREPSTRMSSRRPSAAIGVSAP
jgi:hypothetical protein